MAQGLPQGRRQDARQHAYGGSQEAEGRRRGHRQEPGRRVHRDAEGRQGAHGHRHPAQHVERGAGRRGRGAGPARATCRSTSTCARTCRTSTPSATARASLPWPTSPARRASSPRRRIAGVDTHPIPGRPLHLHAPLHLLLPAGRQPGHDRDSRPRTPATRSRWASSPSCPTARRRAWACASASSS